MEGVTIFVGPNNSGKSLLLREIETAYNQHPFPSGLTILKDYEVAWPAWPDVEADIAKMKHLQPIHSPIEYTTIGRLNPGGNNETWTIHIPTLTHILNAKSDKYWLATQLSKWGVIRLDGRSRFNLTNDQPGGDLIGPPQNVLMHLFQDEDARAKVRTLIEEAFGRYFVIDPTNLGVLRIRLSDQAPLADEQSLNADARAYHSAATYIKDASDGVQAFTGIVTAVCSGEFHTMLVDEPEAFLHPPLARKLGSNLAELVVERGGTLMASTHSADFLMGCVQASTQVRVVRLEYAKGKSRARMIDPIELETFLKRPLMRSANVVSGLFHDGVVICESDNDRAFYSEIYHRLAAAHPGYPSILFVNAQNKQTIKDMMGPLRKFGVPAAAIPDLDIVKDGGVTWTDWLKSAQVPAALHVGYGQMRSAIKEALVASGKDMKVDGGLDLLKEDDRSAADLLLDNLEAYGIFPVRRGELENWLPSLHVPGKKTDWTIAMLERLGTDPASESYVSAGGDDVWEFLRRIVAWISEAGRKGTS